ncbi:helix-turn-helix domain-containing protein [Rhodococcus sp. HNM0569]|uniref:helix-turn-helix domain-containing protein n=1 Tax=Rhodococcus sp. HNM0569 TaxID=2716340 RepID=UPI00146E7C67|nr:helix-turn-helix domain-containing protein [Rhodococcus sp. HNM0569]NLU83493.1 helix-turn-helix domain-containing protein [Rhodococcus sp. HNM0569]
MSWYRPAPAAPDLHDALVCTWTAATEGTHLLVPDGCVDVLWIRGVGLRVCGPETTAWSFALPPGTEAVGVRFRPGVAAAALDVRTSDITDVRVGVDDVLGSAVARRLTDRLDNATTPAERITHFEHAVRHWHTRGDDPLAASVRTALATRNWTVGALAEAHALTERRLQRRCHDLFGYGPATLRGILRLQRFMASAGAQPHATLADLSYVAGYSDQAHLARDCRRIAGMTPSALLASEAPHWHGVGSAVAATRREHVA